MQATWPIKTHKLVEIETGRRQTDRLENIQTSQRKMHYCIGGHELSCEIFWHCS